LVDEPPPQAANQNSVDNISNPNDHRSSFARAGLELAINVNPQNGNNIA